MTLLIKHGTFMTASDTFMADIRVEGESIFEIGQDI
jgi:dihydroorotase-like cyclic amidohydrolase